MWSPLLIRLPTVVVVVATVVVMCQDVAEHHHHRHHHHPTGDDCRPVARRFNDSLKTQDDQLVYDRKTLGESRQLCITAPESQEHRDGVGRCSSLRCDFGCQSTRHMANSSHVTSWLFHFTQLVTSWLFDELTVWRVGHVTSWLAAAIFPIRPVKTKRQKTKPIHCSIRVHHISHRRVLCLCRHESERGIKQSC